jgi:hypothetical protein
MKAEDHIIAWIESSRRHYDMLLEIYRRRQPGCADGFIRPQGIAAAASNLVSAAYSEMVSSGDARRDDPYSAVELLRASILVAEWELRT